MRHIRERELPGQCDKQACADALENEESNGRSTVAFYESHAQTYFERTVVADLEPLYGRFLPNVRPGGRILDLGSGSGRDLKVMRDRGFVPLGIDASRKLARLAADFSGVTCLTMRFEDISFPIAFDAVWACASLLHISKCRIPTILTNIHNSLAAEGVLFASVQLGKGERAFARRPLLRVLRVRRVFAPNRESWFQDSAVVA